jgi:hypothetical protein
LLGTKTSSSLGRSDFQQIEQSVSLGDDTLREALPVGNVEVVAFGVDRVLREKGLAVPPEAPSWRALAFSMLKEAARVNSAVRSRQEAPSNASRREFRNPGRRDRSQGRG